MIISNDSLDLSYSARGPTFLQDPAHNFSSCLQLVSRKIKEKHQTMVSSSPVIYNLSLNIYRDDVKKNKAGKEVGEIASLVSEHS